MKPETILNAFQWAVERRYWVTNEKSERQYRAFRDRILRMFEENEDYIDWSLEAVDYYIDTDYEQRKRIAELEQIINDYELSLSMCKGVL